MQNSSSSNDRSSGIWSRLPSAGRLLIMFWAVSLTALAGVGLYGRHRAAHPAVGGIKNRPTAPISAPESAKTTITPQPARDISQAQPEPISHITASGITETSLPKIGAPNTPATAMALPQPNSAAAPPTDRPALAVVMQGIGYSDTLTQIALAKLPAPVALGISPYVDDISDLIQRARSQGREVFVTLPMQSAHPEHVDEGPHALGYGNTEMQDRQELQWCLDRAAGATGLTDVSENGDDQSNGGYATTLDFAPIAEIMASHNLLYLAGSPDDGRQTKGMTATNWLNGDTDAATLDANLAALLPSASNPAPRILLMVGPLTPVAIQHLSDWLKGPAAKAFTLVPPSTFTDDGQTTNKQAEAAQISGAKSL
ncbi:divergent polysaccharide deacetylase family protein [Gluconobacter wancherniae]|nr:divergent polysaccharide deacetylase family protein [Gluconobacter wancherniae]MBF0853908.1 divergent polysaccharide deacetylase family protein [Gluconobacter wancherniae]GBD56963.1 hypothetical protein NBRC103581_01545 [Gluconobacter wancherniae NBRC 103581]